MDRPTRQELLAENDLLREKLEIARAGLRHLRDYANSEKFNTVGALGSVRAMNPNDVVTRVDEIQFAIDQIESFPYGLCLRISDRSRYDWILTAFGPEGILSRSMSEQAFYDVLSVQMKQWRERLTR